MENDIEKIIFACICEVIDSKDFEISSETSLYGAESPLDSIGFVTLVISIEQMINEKYDSQISLADEKAMSMKNSPFRNISTLKNYIKRLLES